jgi:hypothetical protein
MPWKADFTLASRWRVEAELGEVLDAMADPRELVRWWPSSYLAVRELDPGRPGDGVGKRIEMRVKGFLPYAVRFELEVTENRYPHGISTVARGDLEGEGHWHVFQNGRFTDLHHLWTVRVDRPLLRRLAPLVGPVLAANHRWSMRRGEISLGLELRRRRGQRVPAPPGPTFGWLHGVDSGWRGAVPASTIVR